MAFDAILTLALIVDAYESGAVGSPYSLKSYFESSGVFGHKAVLLGGPLLAMSINWAELNQHKQPIPINDEVIVRSEPNADLMLSFNTPDTNQAPSAKGKAKSNTLRATGSVYVTDQRVGWFPLVYSAIPHDISLIQLVFVSSAFGQPSSFDTFSVQLLGILSIQYQQPYFGSNYLALDIKPAPGGGLTEGAKAELRLKDKGVFELSGTLEKSRERAHYKKRDEMLNPPELREYKYRPL